MNNNVSSVNPNFHGAFILNFSKLGSGMREGFEKAVGGNGRIIMEDFGRKDRILYVLKNSKDYNAANFIKSNGMRFKYMPEVDTKLRFDSYHPEEAEKYIAQNRPRVITKMRELMDFISTNRTKNKTVKNSHKNIYDRICENLMINVQGQKQKDSKGVVTIKDKANDGLVKISPQSKFGISYVYVKPSNKYDPIMRYAIDSEGNKLATFQTPEGIKKFSENFNKAIRHHLHQDNV